VSEQDILSAENIGKPLGSRVSPQTPLGKLTAHLQKPSWWAGDCCLSPTVSHTLSRVMGSNYYKVVEWKNYLNTSK